MHLRERDRAGRLVSGGLWAWTGRFRSPDLREPGDGARVEEAPAPANLAGECVQKNGAQASLRSCSRLRPSARRARRCKRVGSRGGVCQALWELPSLRRPRCSHGCPCPSTGEYSQSGCVIASIGHRSAPSRNRLGQDGTNASPAGQQSFNVTAV
jgi:hypothetical protein